MKFKQFSKAIKKQFDKMTQQGKLYKTNTSKDEIWDTYLKSFSEGTNPIYRERTVHDCNCCKNFIRDVGNAVIINDDYSLTSIWDIKINDETYQAVADIMSQYVKSKEIARIYTHFQKKVGLEKNIQLLDDNSTITWNHFHCEIPNEYVTQNGGEAIGKADAIVKVFKRGVLEITPNALNDVIDLIEDNNLYRGQEHLNNLKSFKRLQNKFRKCNSENFFWKHYKEQGSTIRNSVIGTLLVDLSEGKPLEIAVKSFEDKVSGANYKRPKALVTPAMKQNALKKIKELGLEDSLSRRHAKPEDVSINDVIFADRGTAKVMKGELESLLDVKPKSNTKGNTEITIEDFIKDVVPNATKIEALVENKHSGNFVNILAPIHENAPSILQWDSNFTWSYNGNFADSTMKERVKDAGGRVDGFLRFTNSWNHNNNNNSLMDLHVFLPTHSGHNNGVHNDYGNNNRVGWNHRKHHQTGGIQDVDYTNAAPNNYIPIENITFPDKSKLPIGVYEFKIHNWAKREKYTGFKAEIEANGELFEYDYQKDIQHKEWVHVASAYFDGENFTFTHHLPVGSSSKEIYNLNTNEYHKVSMMMLSPNHWNGQEIGNKHYMFILDGAKNPDTTRGYYNEFLSKDLHNERKAFDFIADKMQVEPDDEQLCGLGFSSTLRAELNVKVDGRPYTIKF